MEMNNGDRERELVGAALRKTKLSLLDLEAIEGSVGGALSSGGNGGGYDAVLANFVDRSGSGYDAVLANFVDCSGNGYDAVLANFVDCGGNGYDAVLANF